MDVIISAAYLDLLYQASDVFTQFQKQGGEERENAAVPAHYPLNGLIRSERR
jgi:hypothetical protein